MMSDRTAIGTPARVSNPQKKAQLASPTKDTTNIAGTTSHDTQHRMTNAAPIGGTASARPNAINGHGPSAEKVESSHVAPGRVPVSSSTPPLPHPMDTKPTG